MSRDVPWRPTYRDDVIASLYSLSLCTLLVVQERGPTSFVLKDISSSRRPAAAAAEPSGGTIAGNNNVPAAATGGPTFKVTIGAINTCSCAVGSKVNASNTLLNNSVPLPKVFVDYMQRQREALQDYYHYGLLVGDGDHSHPPTLSSSTQIITSDRRAVPQLQQPQLKVPTVVSGYGDICHHILFVLTRVFRIPRSNPLIWQKSFLASEIDQVLRGKRRMIPARGGLGRGGGGGAGGRGRGGGAQSGLGTQSEDGDIDSASAQTAGATSSTPHHALRKNEKPIDADDDCPICCDPIVPSAEDVTNTALVQQTLSYCRLSCGKHVHNKCLKEYIRHHESVGGSVVWGTASGGGGAGSLSLPKQPKPLLCPMCRQPWGEVAPFPEDQRALKGPSFDRGGLAATTSALTGGRSSSYPTSGSTNNGGGGGSSHAQTTFVACSSCRVAVGPSQPLYRCAYCVSGESNMSVPSRLRRVVGGGGEAGGGEVGNGGTSSTSQQMRAGSQHDYYLCRACYSSSRAHNHHPFDVSEGLGGGGATTVDYSGQAPVTGSNSLRATIPMGATTTQQDPIAAIAARYGALGAFNSVSGDLLISSPNGGSLLRAWAPAEERGGRGGGAGTTVPLPTSLPPPNTMATASGGFSLTTGLTLGGEGANGVPSAPAPPPSLPPLTEGLVDHELASAAVALMAAISSLPIASQTNHRRQQQQQQQEERIGRGEGREGGNSHAEGEGVSSLLSPRPPLPLLPSAEFLTNMIPPITYNRNFIKRYKKDAIASRRRRRRRQSSSRRSNLNEVVGVGEVEGEREGENREGSVGEEPPHECPICREPFVISSYGRRRGRRSGDGGGGERSTARSRGRGRGTQQPRDQQQQQQQQHSSFSSSSPQRSLEVLVAGPSPSLYSADDFEPLGGGDDLSAGGTTLNQHQTHSEGGERHDNDDGRGEGQGERDGAVEEEGITEEESEATDDDREKREGYDEGIEDDEEDEEEEDDQEYDPLSAAPPPSMIAYVYEEEEEDEERRPTTTTTTTTISAAYSSDRGRSVRGRGRGGLGDDEEEEEEDDGHTAAVIESEVEGTTANGCDCRHVFHYSCLIRYLSEYSTRCPIDGCEPYAVREWRHRLATHPPSFSFSADAADERSEGNTHNNSNTSNTNSPLRGRIRPPKSRGGGVAGGAVAMRGRGTNRGRGKMGMNASEGLVGGLGDGFGLCVVGLGNAPKATNNNIPNITSSSNTNNNNITRIHSGANSSSARPSVSLGRPHQVPNPNQGDSMIGSLAPHSQGLSVGPRGLSLSSSLRTGNTEASSLLGTVRREGVKENGGFGGGSVAAGIGVLRPAPARTAGSRARGRAQEVGIGRGGRGGGESTPSSFMLVGGGLQLGGEGDGTTLALHVRPGDAQGLLRGRGEVGTHHRGERRGEGGAETADRHEDKKHSRAHVQSMGPIKRGGAHREDRGGGEGLTDEGLPKTFAFFASPPPHPASLSQGQPLRIVEEGQLRVATANNATPQDVTLSSTPHPASASATSLFSSPKPFHQHKVKPVSSSRNIRRRGKEEEETSSPPAPLVLGLAAVGRATSNLSLN